MFELIVLLCHLEDCVKIETKPVESCAMALRQAREKHPAKSVIDIYCRKLDEHEFASKSTGKDYPHIEIPKPSVL